MQEYRYGHTQKVNKSQHVSVKHNFEDFRYLRLGGFGLVLRENDPPQTQCRQHLSCYRPDFDQTLKVASWEHLEQIPTVMVTFAQATFVLATFVHIRNISAVTDLILIKLYLMFVFIVSYDVYLDI